MKNCVSQGAMIAAYIWLLVMVPVTCLAAAQILSSGTAYSVGTNPSSVAVGDFNGDGKPDVVASNFSSNTVSVMRNNGDGTFVPAVDYGVGPQPLSVVVGDFNGDGKIDIVTANQASYTVSVLMNNGDGTFATAVGYGVGVNPQSVRVGDFNGDGKPDIVVANDGSQAVSVLLNNGDGTFATVINYGVGTQPVSVAVDDFNSDGKLDIVAANASSNNISVLMNNGNGTFAATDNYSVGVTPVSVAVGDYNDDGKPDIIVANYNSSSISVLLNNGNGIFAAAVVYTIGANPQSIAVGDFNGDGKLDIVSANANSSTASILLNNGNGTFAAAVDYAIGANPYSIAVGDFNVDGKPDIVTSNFFSNTITVLLNVLPNNGGGIFNAAVGYGVGMNPYSVAVGDFNDDGKPDIVTANDSSGTTSVLLNNGDGTFATAANYSVGVDPISVAVGDFNSDGKPDLVIANSTSNTISVLLNNGNGTFATSVNYGVVANPYSVAVGDFNGDGEPDIVTANLGSMITSVLLNNGDGTFGTAVNYYIGVIAYSVAVGDFNGDGKLDIVIASLNSSTVSVLFNNGNGTFASAINYGVGTSPFSVAVGDVNGDGKPDILTANYDGNTASVLLNNGDGTFAAAVDYSVGLNPRSIAIGDFNGDGRLDIVTANANSFTTSILLNNGNGTFTAAGNYGVDTAPFSIAVGDFNRDGKPDIVTASFLGNSVSILFAINTQPAPFAFTPQTGVALTTAATSNAITVTGINAGSPISVVGGEYSINGGAFTSIAGTVFNGDTIMVKQTSSGSYSTTTTTTLTIGGVSSSFNVTTGFTIISYTLTYIAGTNGSINGTTPQTVNNGGSGTPVTAVANPGFQFVSWSDGVLTAARTDANVTADISVTANFAPLPPIISGPTASSITQNGATLNGTVVANGADTTVVFEYGLTTAYGRTITALQSPLAANAAGSAVSAAITGLTCGTTYHYRINGQNSAGTTNGLDASFTSSACPAPGAAIITTVAGNGTATFAGDGGAGITASLNYPYGITADSYGNYYIADTVNSRVRKISAISGIITTIAGGGFSGDGGLATSANLNNPEGIVLDNSGNLFIGTSNQVRKVALSTGIITTVAGNGLGAFAGDGGPAVSASLYSIRGIALDDADNLYIVDSGNARVRKVDAVTGIITTVAGNGTVGSSGDGGPAISASLWAPSGVAVDSAGDIFIADFGTHTVRKISAVSNIITTVAGNGIANFSGDGGPATSASLVSPYGIALDSSGNIYISDYSINLVRKVNASTGIITTVAGTGSPTFTGDGGLATLAGINGPRGLAVDGSGALLIADLVNQRVRKVFTAGSTSATISYAPAGPYKVGDQVAITASFNDLVVDAPIPRIALSGANNLAATDMTKVDNTHYTYIHTVTAGNGSVTVSIPTGTDINGIPVSSMPVSGASFAVSDSPSATTATASAITLSGATLNGTVNDNGFDTAVTFEYGLTVAYGNSVSAGTVAAGSGNTAVSAAISALACGSTYHYRVVAINSAGRADGLDAIFTTGACPVPVTMTVQTSPTGLSFSVDGTSYNTAFTADWLEGNSHTLATVSPQTLAGVQYGFSGWSDGGAISHGVLAQATATTYTVSFAPLQPVISGTAAGSAVAGFAYSFTPTASNAGSFSVANLPAWMTFDSATGALSGTPVPANIGTYANIVITALNGPLSASLPPFSITVIANISTVTIQTSPSGRSFRVDGVIYSSPQTFTWTPGSVHTIATSSPQGTGGTRYVFNNWSDGGALSHSMTAVAGTRTITANFDTQYRLTTSVSPAGSGTVTPANGSFFAPGSVVNLLATPAATYLFSSWTGPVASSTSAATTVTMSGPVTVRANMVRPPLLSASITNKSGPMAARVWTFTLTNASGRSTAMSARIDGLSLTQTAGSACAPVITSPAAFPLVLGNIGAGSSRSGNVTINFSGCATGSLFSATLQFSSNGGAYSWSRTFNNQAR